MRWLLLLILLAVGCGPIRCGEAEINIMVLSFGQSNSNGVTSSKYLFNERENVFFLKSCGWNTYHDYDRIGPEASLGERLGIEYPDKNIGVIKIAHPGSKIERWLPGTPFNNQIYNTIEKAKEYGGSDEIAGYFWMQGETDSVEYMDSINYESSLSYLITSLRSDNAPFVIGLIGTDIFPYIDNVREAQAYVAASTSRVYTVETNDLKKHRDDLHFTEDSLKILGERFAEKFIENMP